MAASQSFCSECGAANHHNQVCRECGGGIGQDPDDETPLAVPADQAQVSVPENEIPEMPPLEAAEVDTDRGSFPYLWLLSNFARTLGDTGFRPTDYTNTHQPGLGGMGFRLVIAADDVDSDSPNTEGQDNTNMADPEMPNLESDDDGMSGLEPEELELDGPFQRLFQPLHVRLQLQRNPNPDEINLDASVLRELIRNGHQPSHLFPDRINTLLLDLFADMVQQEAAQRSVTVDQLEEIPLLPVDQEMADQNQTCAVCLDVYAVGESYKSLRCHHLFHGSCVDRWLLEHGNCPICRAPFVDRTLNPESAIVSADGVALSGSNSLNSLD